MKETKEIDRMRPWADHGLNVDVYGKSEQTVTCPECSAHRSHKHQKTKCCSVNVDYGVWHCHHCNASGYVPSNKEIAMRTAKQKRIEAMRDKVPEMGKYTRPKEQPGFSVDYILLSARAQLLKRKTPSSPDPSSPPLWGEGVTGGKVNDDAEGVTGSKVNDDIGTDEELIALVQNAQQREVLTYLTKERHLTLDTLGRAPFSIPYIQSIPTANTPPYTPDGLPIEGEMPGGQRGSESVMRFLYRDHKVLINQKTRKMDKSFWMHKGAEVIPYNIDAIMRKEVCYITEGEFDVMSLMQAGFPEAISVPTGGSNTNLEWLDRFAETLFADKKRIFICTDNDTVGYGMMKELVRRLGGYRCRIVLWDDDCKDANEELVAHGEEGIRRCIEAAKSVPEYGVETAKTPHVERELDDLFHNGMGTGAEIGIKNIDRLITYETGRFMLVTGRPGDGKSEFLDEICLRLALKHGWKTAYFSPENFPLKYHLAKLISKLSGYEFREGSRLTQEYYERCKEWLSQNMCHIMPDSEADDALVDFNSKVDIAKLFRSEIGQEAFTLNQVLTVAREAVVRRGIRVLVLDPLNSILRDEEDKGLSDIDWDLEVCNKLLAFAHANDVLVILVAHPRKVDRATMTNAKRRVEMNDINGSSKFGAKCDYCLVIDRDDDLQVVNAYVDKVKFKHLGTRGSTTLFYDIVSGRYINCEVKQLTPNELTKYQQMGTPKGSEILPKNDRQYLVTKDWSYFNVRWI